MDYILQLLKLLVVLALFIGATYFVLKNMKKRQINKVSPNGLIQVIDGVSIGMKEEVILLKVGKEYILMSVGSGQMLGLRQEEIAAPEVDFDEYFARENPTMALKGLTKTLKERMVKK